jgi:hypothetical protein
VLVAMTRLVSALSLTPSTLPASGCPMCQKGGAFFWEEGGILSAWMHLLGKLGSCHKQLHALSGLTFLTDSLSGL